jgi:hypothetical protein
VEIALIREAAEALNMREEEFIDRAGFIVAGNFAFRKDYIEAMKKIILTRLPKTLLDLMKVTGLDMHVVSELATVIGIKIRYAALDPEGVFLDYAGCDLGNENKNKV